MIVLVVGLAASVLYEHAQAPSGCWQGSLSASAAFWALQTAELWNQGLRGSAIPGGMDAR